MLIKQGYFRDAFDPAEVIRISPIGTSPVCGTVTLLIHFANGVTMESEKIPKEGREAPYEEHLMEDVLNRAQRTVINTINKALA